MTASPHEGGPRVGLLRRRLSLAGLFAVLLLTSLWAFQASSAGDHRHSISGTVICGGQPLPSGTIQFLCQLRPIEFSDESCDITVAIENGRFEVPQRQGLVPGLYLVKIRPDSSEYVPRTVAEEDIPFCGATPSVPVQVKPEQLDFILIGVKAGREHQYHFELIK